MRVRLGGEHSPVAALDLTGSGDLTAALTRATVCVDTDDDYVGSLDHPSEDVGEQPAEAGYRASISTHRW